MNNHLLNYFTIYILDINIYILIKSFKVRIYPNEEQIFLLEKTFGANRFIYNYFLNLKIKLYEYYEINLSYNNSSKALTELKKQRTWLKQVDAISLQQTLRDLDSAYQNFFSGRTRYPNFKKKQDKNSYRTNSNIKINNRYITIPKIGMLRYRDKYKLEECNISKIYNVTISKTPSGNYYASISAEVDIPVFEKTNRSCGIDLGLKDFLIFDTGKKINNPRILKSLEKKYRKLAKAISRKQLKSKNRNKARIKLAKFHEKIVNTRKDFLHKLSTNLIKEYDIICVEDLCFKAFMRTNKAKSYQDVAQSEFIRMLIYKAEWYGKTISKINRFYPSTQLCSECGYKNPDIKNLDIREYDCPECGTHHDRDINAAINILREGLRILEETI